MDRAYREMEESGSREPLLLCPSKRRARVAATIGLLYRASQQKDRDELEDTENVVDSSEICG